LLQHISSIPRSTRRRTRSSSTGWPSFGQTTRRRRSSGRAQTRNSRGRNSRTCKSRRRLQCCDHRAPGGLDSRSLAERSPQRCWAKQRPRTLRLHQGNSTARADCTLTQLHVRRDISSRSACAELGRLLIYEAMREFQPTIEQQARTHGLTDQTHTCVPCVCRPRPFLEGSRLSGWKGCALSLLHLLSMGSPRLVRRGCGRGRCARRCKRRWACQQTRCSATPQSLSRYARRRCLRGEGSQAKRVQDEKGPLSRPSWDPWLGLRAGSLHCAGTVAVSSQVLYLKQHRSGPPGAWRTASAGHPHPPRGPGDAGAGGAGVRAHAHMRTYSAGCPRPTLCDRRPSRRPEPCPSSWQTTGRRCKPLPRVTAPRCAALISLISIFFCIAYFGLYSLYANPSRRPSLCGGRR
jgi:hypothetical protein